MYIDWIGLHAKPGTISCQSLNFVKHHNERPKAGLLRNHLCKQMLNRLLAFSERRTRKGVRLYLDISELPLIVYGLRSS
jgi:hypothetical protein